MNKELFAKVKDKCKDMGLSEKCLTAITEAMGGSVADDSTDTDAIESTANLIVSVATASQSEATRWVNKAKGTPKPNHDKKDGKGDCLFINVPSVLSAIPPFEPNSGTNYNNHNGQCSK